MMTPERSKELFEICEREGTVKFESMKQAKDGTIFPVDVVGNFYCIDGQKVFCTFIRDTTEIKASLKQLRLNQFGVDSARDAIFWLTSEGQIKYANNAASRFFLTSCEDLVQLEFSELEPGLTESNWKERLELCRETKTHHHESRLVRTDGEMFDAEMHFNLLYFEGEELLLVSIKDVTQSKIENKSLMQFRHVIDQVPDSITLTNEQGVVVDANQAHCRRLGYDKHELVGQSISLYDKSLVEENGTCLAPESFKAFKADATGKHFFETIQTTKNGEEQHVEIRSTKIAVDGETFICSVIRDITAQKLGREQTERQLGLTVEAVDRLIDAMFWHDEAGNFIYVNDRACESLGYTRDELLQMNVGDVDPVVAARMVAFPGRGFPAAPFVEETEHKRKDGTCFPAELRVSKLTSGRESIYCAVARDLTDLKATEKRMSELSSQVAHLNRVGSMGQMASAMAHELNQPLAAISNNAFMLQGIVETEMPTDTDALMIAKDIGEQAVMSGQIVHRLRGFITDSSPCRELSEVNQIVVDSAKLIQHRLRHSKVSVQTDLFEGIPLVSVDRIQLQQVVVNLLGNALEAIEESDSLLRSIVVRTHYEELSDTVKIEIEDSGGGVEEEMMDRLFEPFYSTKDAGMGMGLAISRSIVISHGGTLDFTSDEYGTIFCIELPTQTSVVKV
jgi:two-component system sensor kinase FixL